MGFLRTLFWMALTVVVVVFSLRNWTTVTLDLFGGLAADVKLPVLIVGAFLIGFVPLFLYHKVTRWQDRRRVAATIAAPVSPLAPAVPVAEESGLPLPGALSDLPEPK